jgi:hypothetical protein
MDKKFTATLLGATRKSNSTNGNPTWLLHTDAGDYGTEKDGAIGYEVANHTGGPGNWIGKRVRFTATARGRVWDWTLA